MKKFEGFRNFVLGMLVFGVLTISLSACPKKQAVKKTPDEDASSQDDVESTELDLHGKDFVTVPELQTIRFEYDSSELKDEARNILARNAEYLKKNPGVQVLCEGHTDERGTVGYNLTLGQKRAQSVRQYYASLGLSQKQIGSLSYGKEKPACIDTGEDCWSQNRRVETKARIPEQTK